MILDWDFYIKCINLRMIYLFIRKKYKNGGRELVIFYLIFVWFL